jgi:CRP/FNR family transcriptional regulator, anaerobic regulatory protein
MASELAAKLSRYLELTAGEKAALHQLETHEKRLRGGDVLSRENEPSDLLWVVRSGWLQSSSRLPNGERQILRFHYKGDLIGLSSIAWAETAETLTAVSDCTVAPFQRRLLGRVFVAEPRLSAMLYAVAAAESVVMSDRLQSLGRSNARARLSSILLGIISRLRHADPRITDSFHLPLTQTELGDAAGLTKVHVNRTLRDMEEEGLIARNGRTVRVVDEAAMVALSGFKDRLEHIATDWLPGVTASATSARAAE